MILYTWREYLYLSMIHPLFHGLHQQSYSHRCYRGTSIWPRHTSQSSNWQKHQSVPLPLCGELHYCHRNRARLRYRSARFHSFLLHESVSAPHSDDADLELWQKIKSRDCSRNLPRMNPLSMQYCRYRRMIHCRHHTRHR